MTLILCSFLACSESGTDTLSESNKTEFIPLAGNAYSTDRHPGFVDLEDGLTNWNDGRVEIEAFFYVGELTTAQIGIRGKTSGKSVIELEINNQRETVELESDDFESVTMGDFELTKPGYQKATLRGLDKEGEYFANITDLFIVVPEDIRLQYVRENENNRFYWGRRGPSIHLTYGDLPEDENIEWFYSEITVPEDYDPVGSYFMTNGFGEGYFGIQVNSEDERRVLFSVWSPYQTDDPSDIPEDQRIQVLDHGEDVIVGEFGNEGSGGQSYKVYNWNTGVTYRFLNSIKPDGRGNTIYTGYFYAPETSSWHLIARFLRPQTDTWYTRPHSFLENFSYENGHIERKAYYHNQWARKSDGTWIELNQAKFTGDDIAQIGYRLDYATGTEGGQFYLRNGGFFDSSVELGGQLSRSPMGKPPEIDGEKLLYFE